MLTLKGFSGGCVACGAYSPVFSLVYSPKGYAPDAAGVNGPVGFSLFI